MKKTRFSEEQMVKILREADKTPVKEVAKKHAVRDTGECTTGDEDFRRGCARLVENNARRKGSTGEILSMEPR